MRSPRRSTRSNGLRQDMTKEAAEEILELPRRYTKEDVRKAYTDLARRYHPDAASRHHFSPEAAQARMVEANKAHAVLRELFEGAPDRVVERGWDAGIAHGFAGVDWKAGAGDPLAEGDDPWAFADEWGGDPMPERAPLSVRSVLLGPVVLRVVLTAAFACLWWQTFPLLAHNQERYFPEGAWTLLDVARLVMGMVYPSYLVVYEAASGYVSGFVREVLNGMVSWVTRHYVDLRPRSASYGCALYKLLREEVYALIIGPLALFVAGIGLAQENTLFEAVLVVVAVLLGIDALAACVHGGFVNVWSTALADRVEANYLLVRARLLKRCDAWRDGRR